MEDVAAWRQATRIHLVERRMAIDPGQRQSWSMRISENLRVLLTSMAPGILGSYWPFKGEFDPRALVIDLLTRGWTAALPVVTAKNCPLTYRAWTPEARMVRGVLGIMIPSDGTPVVPAVVLAPLVGFDAARYRLGNGGGYFDRTLAALSPAPFAIGIGFELGRLQTIHPQPHDRPMDAIVTEESIAR
jgi:5-formyltetrahydrofolate cyclo-ligase